MLVCYDENEQTHECSGACIRACGGLLVCQVTGESFGENTTSYENAHAQRARPPKDSSGRGGFEPFKATLRTVIDNLTVSSAREQSERSRATKFRQVAYKQLHATNKKGKTTPVCALTLVNEIWAFLERSGGDVRVRHVVVSLLPKFASQSTCECRRISFLSLICFPIPGGDPQFRESPRLRQRQYPLSDAS
jgi:hypothetical protein